MTARAWVRAVAGATSSRSRVSRLLAWNVLADAHARELHIAEPSRAPMFSFGLASFAVAVLLGGGVTDRLAPRWLAVVGVPALAPRRRLTS